MSETVYVVWGRLGLNANIDPWHVCACLTERGARRVVEDLTAVTSPMIEKAEAAFTEGSPDRDRRYVILRELIARHPDPEVRGGIYLFGLTYWYEGVAVDSPAWLEEHRRDAKEGCVG